MFTKSKPSRGRLDLPFWTGSRGLSRIYILISVPGLLHSPDTTHSIKCRVQFTHVSHILAQVLII